MYYLIRYILVPALVTILYFYGNQIIEKPEMHPVRSNLLQEEVKRVAMLLNNDGTPAEYGYLKTPLRLFTESSLSKLQKLRLKKWDIVDVVTEDFYLSATISDMLILGKIQVLFYDFKTGVTKSIEKNILPVFIPNQSPTSYRMFNGTADDIVFQQGDFKFAIRNIDNKITAKYHQRNITITSASDDLNVNLLWNITNNQEGVGLVAPLSQDKTQFLYKFKYTNIPAEGTVQFGSNKYEVTQENSGSGYEYSRGIWPYAVHYWNARAQGHLEDGKRVSINLGSGAGETNLSQATEDAFFVERYMYKLNTAQAKFNESNINSTWTFNCVESALPFSECSITFTANNVHNSGFNLFAFKSSTKKVFGTFSGWVSNDDGKKTRFDNINGFVEVNLAKW